MNKDKLQCSTQQPVTAQYSVVQCITVLWSEVLYTLNMSTLNHSLVQQCALCSESQWNTLQNSTAQNSSVKVEAYYNGPEFKCQPASGTGWFSYKICTKNSKTLMVSLFKPLVHFEITILKYKGKSIFLLFVFNYIS